MPGISLTPAGKGLRIFRITETELLYFDLRLPRVMLAGLTGAVLGVSGTLLQGLFRNPIVEPGLAGTSAGAALGAALVFVLGRSTALSFTAPLGDRPISSFRAGELARTRAVLSQHVELAFPLPVEDVVLMGRYPHYGSAPTSRDRDIVSRSLELVGMTEKRRQPYPTLSGGEQQKVQLARVLAQIWNQDDAHEHKYLFLDEPTTSLDVHYQLHLLDVARDLLAHNCTVVAVLHDLNVAFQYGQHLFVMDAGRLVYEASRASDISAALIERVFRVRATSVGDNNGAEGQATWRFSL